MNTIKNIITAVFMLCASVSYAACDGSVVYVGKSTEVQGDMYSRYGYPITVLNQNYYGSIANMKQSGQYQITEGNDFTLSYDMKNNVITLLYPTTTGRMAVIFDGVVFPEFSKFNTCI